MFAEESIQTIMEKVSTNYQYREGLLSRSRGECSIYLQRLPPDDDLQKRLRENMGLNEGGTLVLTGENTARIQWMQREGKVRMDKYMPLNEDMPSQMFGTKNMRVAYDANVSRYYDLSTGIAYLNNPPSDVSDVTGIHTRFNIAKLYEFGGRSLADALAAIAAKGMVPEISQSEVGGIPCIRLRYTLEKSKENILFSERATTYDLAPGMGYSLVRARFFYREFWEGAVSRESERTYSASYTESSTYPGVWLIDTMESSQDMDIKDRIKATIHRIEIGVDVDEKEFTLEGLGVPDATIVADKRLPGKSVKFLYHDGELIPLPESNAEELLMNSTSTPEVGAAQNEIPEFAQRMQSIAVKVPQYQDGGKPRDGKPRDGLLFLAATEAAK